MQTAPTVILGNHPLLPAFILARLAIDGALVSIVAADARRFQQVLARAAGASPATSTALAERMTRLETVQRPVAASRSCCYLVFLERAETAAWLAPSAQAPDLRLQLATLPAQLQPGDQVLLVCAMRDLGMQGDLDATIAQLEAELQTALPIGVTLRTICIAPFYDDLAGTAELPDPAGSALSDAGAAIVDMIDDVQHRVPRYFERYRLQLPAKESFSVPLLSASAVAHCISAAVDEQERHSYIVMAEQSVAAADILERLPTRFGFHGYATGAAVDSASAVLRQTLDAIAARYGLNRLHARVGADSSVQIRRLGADLAGLEALLAQVLHRREQHRAQSLRPLLALPGISTRTTPDGRVTYHTVGQGAQALLLVGAFGLGSDFWQTLAGTLSAHCKIVILDRVGANEGSGTLPRTYYASADSVNALTDAVKQVMDAEALTSVHVVTWCSGAKIGIELARTLPAAIASLSMIAPSFAGLDGFAGSDSQYERSLATMSKLVSQTPAMAAGMAASMLKIMTKSDSDLDRFQKTQKDPVDVLSLADTHHLPALYAPFLNPENLRDFCKQLMHFRAHDVRPALAELGTRLPIMLINGTLDAATSTERSKDLCRRQGKVLAYDVKGAGHYLLHQHHDIVAALVRGFIHGAPLGETAHFDARVACAALG